MHKNMIMHRNLNPHHILISKTSNEVVFCGVKSIYFFVENYLFDERSNLPYKAPEYVSAENLLSTVENDIIACSRASALFKNIFSSSIKNILCEIIVTSNWE